jgi:D-Tyr-tRNAtyr deacylase
MRIVENVVRSVLKELSNKPMVLKAPVSVSDGLKYHLEKNIPLSENRFKIYSDSFINLINEVRTLYKKGYIELSVNDRAIVESDLAKKVILENGDVVYLEVPEKNNETISEAEYQGRKVQLGKIMQGDVKKSKVYVKNDKGKVVKVNFGFGGKSAKGKRMTIKKNNPARRKSFRARHNCDNPGPRWKPRYWACRTW